MHVGRRDLDTLAGVTEAACRALRIGVEVDPPGVEGVAGADERREPVVDDHVLPVHPPQPELGRVVERGRRGPGVVAAEEDLDGRVAHLAVVAEDHEEREEPPDEGEHEQQEGHLARRQGVLRGGDEQQHPAGHDRQQDQRQRLVTGLAAAEREDGVARDGDRVDLGLGSLPLPPGCQQLAPHVVRERPVEVHGGTQEARHALVDRTQSQVPVDRHACRHLLRHASPPDCWTERNDPTHGALVSLATLQCLLSVTIPRRSSERR